MPGISRAEGLLDQMDRVALGERLDGPQFLDGDHRVVLHVGVEQGDAAAGPHRRGDPFPGNDVDDGDGPQHAVGKPHLRGDAEGLLQVHVAGERIEIARAQHHRGRGGARRDGQGGQTFGLREKLGALVVVGHVERIQFL